MRPPSSNNAIHEIRLCRRGACPRPCPRIAAADLAAGAAKAQTCTACHGPAGISQTAETPSLAGQPDGFLQWQLVYFRNGVRKSPVMQPIAATLKDDDIRNLAACFAAQKPPGQPRRRTDERAMAAGRKVAQANRCASCHKDDYSGTQATPRLAAQREDYLLKALREFKAGTRNGGGVAAMAEVVIRSATTTCARWRISRLTLAERHRRLHDLRPSSQRQAPGAGRPSTRARRRRCAASASTRLPTAAIMRLTWWYLPSVSVSRSAARAGRFAGRGAHGRRVVVQQHAGQQPLDLAGVDRVLAAHLVDLGDVVLRRGQAMDQLRRRR